MRRLDHAVHDTVHTNTHTYLLSVYNVPVYDLAVNGQQNPQVEVNSPEGPRLDTTEHVGKELRPLHKEANMHR